PNRHLPHLLLMRNSAISFDNFSSRTQYISVTMNSQREQFSTRVSSSILHQTNRINATEKILTAVPRYKTLILRSLTIKSEWLIDLLMARLSGIVQGN
ncbi:hypothetical protein PFISCL1PPCAC_17311, partial [Pristionchus fissidentatus]